jgi:hypothetical protein
MGATSVTGKGIGVGRGKGPKNNRTEFVPLLSPHVVTAGHCTTSGGGTVTVTFTTPLVGAAANYAVVASAASGTTSHSIAKTTNSDGNFSAFTLTGANSTAHSYIISTVGVPFVE